MWAMPLSRSELGERQDSHSSFETDSVGYNTPQRGSQDLQASELFITTTALHRSHPHTSSSPAPHPHTNRAAGRMWDDVYRSVLPVHTLADVEYYKVMLSLAVGAIFVCVVIAILLSWFWHHKAECDKKELAVEEFVNREALMSLHDEILLNLKAKCMEHFFEIHWEELGWVHELVSREDLNALRNRIVIKEKTAYAKEIMAGFSHHHLHFLVSD
jgi:hypothetical protein